MFHVLSFDPERVTVSSCPDGKMIVNKKTTKKEYANILLAQQHILKHPLILIPRKNKVIRIATAEIFRWNENEQLLSTLFSQGKNLEQVLRKTFGTKRGKFIHLIRMIFESFKENGFLWGGFAPRNMILNQSKGIICIVDFERESQFKDLPIERFVFNRYVRNYSFEEFSCFLTHDEKEILFYGFLDEDENGIVERSHIASKRKCALLEILFSMKEYYSLAEVRYAEDIMSAVVTPFLVHDLFFFPMDLIDLIGKKGGPNEYARIIMSIYKLGESERFSQLKKCAKAL